MMTGPTTSSTSPGLHLRAVTPQDVEEVCALLAVALPDARITPDVYRWLYLNNPFGPSSNVVWAQDGRIIAHAGLFASPGHLSGRPITVGRTSHAVTARDYRGRGLYGALTRRQLDTLDPAIDLIVGLPTASATAGLESAGVVQRHKAERWFRPREQHFRDLGRMPRQMTAALTRIAFGPGPQAAGDRVDGVPDGVDDLVHDGSEDGIGATAAWWQWRFLQQPSRHYAIHELRADGRLRAACASRVEDLLGLPFLNLMYWQASDEEAAERVLGAAMRDAENHAGVTLLATEGSVTAEWARRCGMRRLPAILDEVSGPVMVAQPPGTAAPLPERRWAVALADYPHL